MNQKIQISPIIKKILNLKGISSDKDIADFFSWDLKKIDDLTSLCDLEKAANTIIEHILEKKVIAVFGDYDADGTTSCALLYHFFKMLSTPIKLIQPNRMVEGYGLGASSVEKMASDGIDLIITVDCGITSYDAALKAKDLNTTLIITDHHAQGREDLPSAFAVINPNRLDETCSPSLKKLAGVGVAFALSLAIRKKMLEKKIPVPSIYPLLQFVAIGTISDVAELNNLNRILTRHGLNQIKSTSFYGLKKLFPPEERNKRVIGSDVVAFKVGPMINSKGRIDRPDDALSLLIANCDEIAQEKFNVLKNSNDERKFLQAEVFNSAREIVIKEISDESSIPVIIVYSSDWHEGVIGIVASKLVETFLVPAIVFTDAEDKSLIKASVRSTAQINIFNELNKFKNYFIKFGGHACAAGITMEKEKFLQFKTEFQAHMQNIIKDNPYTDSRMSIDISPEEINPALLKELELLEPFGNGNERPLFKMSNIKIDSFSILKEKHVRWMISSKSKPQLKFQGISFNYINRLDAKSPQELFKEGQLIGEQLNVYFELASNYFNGNEYMQLMVYKITQGPLS